VKLNLSLWALLLMFACGPVSAQKELVAVPNRPTVSTPAQPVQVGVLETEWGVDAASSHRDMNALLKFGLTTNFELRLANNPFTEDFGANGFGDTSVGFKYRFTRDSGYKPSIAFMYMYKVPTAAGVLGSGEADHVLTFLASKDVGKHHFDFNSGVVACGAREVECDRRILRHHFSQRCHSRRRPIHSFRDLHRAAQAGFRYRHDGQAGWANPERNVHCRRHILDCRSVSRPQA
jgi:hypothetical protein